MNMVNDVSQLNGVIYVPLHFVISLRTVYYAETLILIIGGRYDKNLY